MNICLKGAGDNVDPWWALRYQEQWVLVHCWRPNEDAQVTSIELEEGSVVIKCQDGVEIPGDKVAAVSNDLNELFSLTQGDFHPDPYWVLKTPVKDLDQELLLKVKSLKEEWLKAKNKYLAFLKENAVEDPEEVDSLETLETCLKWELPGIPYVKEWL